MGCRVSSAVHVVFLLFVISAGRNDGLDKADNGDGLVLFRNVLRNRRDGLVTFATTTAGRTITRTGASNFIQAAQTAAPAPAAFGVGRRSGIRMKIARRFPFADRSGRIFALALLFYSHSFQWNFRLDDYVLRLELAAQNPDGWQEFSHTANRRIVIHVVFLGRLHTDQFSRLGLVNQNKT